MFLHRHFNRFAVSYFISTLFISHMAISAPKPLGERPLGDAASVSGTASAASPASIPKNAIALDVFKSPTCGCCETWVTHIETHGFQAKIHHPVDLNQEKIAHGIKPQYQSCHTAISKDGYIFEGHIPANIIQRFLTEKPKDAIGLAVPGMPTGSPGMEVGNQFTPYDVLLVKADGSSRIYTRITRIEQQHLRHQP